MVASALCRVQGGWLLVGSRVREGGVWKGRVIEAVAALLAGVSCTHLDKAQRILHASAVVRAAARVIKLDLQVIGVFAMLLCEEARLLRMRGAACSDGCGHVVTWLPLRRRGRGNGAAILGAAARRGYPPTPAASASASSTATAAASFGVDEALEFTLVL